MDRAIILILLTLVLVIRGNYRHGVQLEQYIKQAEYKVIEVYNGIEFVDYTLDKPAPCDLHHYELDGYCYTPVIHEPNYDENPRGSALDFKIKAQNEKR